MLRKPRCRTPINPGRSWIGDVHPGCRNARPVGTDPVNGRAAVIYRSPLAMPICDAAVESPDGTLLVSLTVPPSPAAVPAPCDQIREVATVVAEALNSN